MIIPRKCQVCNRMIWWWDKIEWMEMTPDFCYSCHEKCFTPKNYEIEIDKWFKEIGLNPHKLTRK